jgi:hypothetical protein
MRLEKQREEEVARRKGLAVKTVLGLIWLGICFAAAYFFVGWLFETGELRPSFFWNQLFIPRSINADWVQVLAAIIIVVIMNFFVLLGFGFTSRKGRVRPGTPSLRSRNPDPLDKKYY